MHALKDFQIFKNCCVHDFSRTSLLEGCQSFHTYMENHCFEHSHTALKIDLFPINFLNFYLVDKIIRDSSIFLSHCSPFFILNITFSV